MKKKIHAVYNSSNDIMKLIASDGIIIDLEALTQLVQSFAKEAEEYSDLDRAVAQKIFDPVLHRELRKEAGNFLSSTDDEKLLSAFRLGALHQMNMLLVNETNEKREKGSKSKRQHWATLLAKELVSKYPGKTFAQLWSLIPQSEDFQSCRYDGFEVYRDGDRLYADNGNSKDSKSIAKCTFETSYVSRIAKKS